MLIILLKNRRKKTLIYITIINKTSSKLVSPTGRVIFPTCTLTLTDYNASTHFSLHCDTGSCVLSPKTSKKYKVINFGRIRAYNSEDSDNTVIVEEI